MSRRLPLSVVSGSARRGVSTTSAVREAVAANSPVAIGVSGGKDSAAAAIAAAEFLDRSGHCGPRILIHADLGVVEWRDSLPACQRLASLLGMDLVVVRRPQGDMMDRWEQRWRDNVRRWSELSCVKLILPWSTPSMRFCTSELKVDQICRELVRRFPGREIVNVTGIRREESTARAAAAVSAAQPKLTRKSKKTTGLDWHPILDWTAGDVFALAASRGFRSHEAYDTFGSSRVSCVYCMLATEADHTAGARDVRNHVLGRRMVDLEVASTFSFQSSRWLGDTLFEILDDARISSVAGAKIRAEAREAAEAEIPKHLLYTKGWPTCMPTRQEAGLLASVRSRVADAVGIKPAIVTRGDVLDRYRWLLEANGRDR